MKATPESIEQRRLLRELAPKGVSRSVFRSLFGKNPSAMSGFASRAGIQFTQYTPTSETVMRELLIDQGVERSKIDAAFEAAAKQRMADLESKRAHIALPHAVRPPPAPGKPSAPRQRQHAQHGEKGEAARRQGAADAAARMRDIMASPPPKIDWPTPDEISRQICIDLGRAATEFAKLEK